jgi:hypothetical protein
MEPFAEDAWDAWSPEELFGRLRHLDLGWYVVGGWALDLWHGHQTRAHEDLEFCVLAGQSREFRTALIDLDFFTARNGVLTHLPPTSELPVDAWQLWGADRTTGCWRVDMMIERGTPDLWRYKRDGSLAILRDTAIRKSKTGIPYLAPALVLLFKAKHVREKDQRDFDAAVARMDPAEKRALRGWLEALHPGHNWIATL